jgi:hypothetical protein
VFNSRVALAGGGDRQAMHDGSDAGDHSREC